MGFGRPAGTALEFVLTRYIMAKKAKVVKEKSIEDRIWDSANKLRGNLTASEYQNVVLGLVFLKYISDCFEKRYNELVEEGDGFEEDRDEYTAEHVFWVPQDARWQNIASNAQKPFYTYHAYISHRRTHKLFFV